jgi:hypothetical protein
MQEKIQVQHIILFLLIIIIVSFYRSPFIFLNGRFVGEEALYFLNALNSSFVDSFLFYIPDAGYYNLIPNIFTKLATYPPLEFAPFFTVYGSFIIILNLFIICLFYESDFLSTKTYKLTACIILLIGVPFVPEIWVNTLNSQIYLCFTSIIILFIRKNNTSNNLFLRINILIAGLSGIYSCVLTPIFFLKYYLNKNSFNFINFFILLGCSIFQATLILYSKFSGKLLESKLQLILNINIFNNFLYNSLLKPIFGRQLIHLLYEKFNFTLPSLDELFLLIALIIIVSLIVFYIFYKKYFIRDYVLQFLFLSFFLLSFVIIIGSVGTHLGGRYAALPGGILLLIILRFFIISRDMKIRIFFITILIVSIVIGATEFRPPTERVKHQYIKFLDCINCPIWKDEIKQWKKNNNHTIGIWPYPNKNFKLIIN